MLVPKKKSTYEVSLPWCAYVGERGNNYLRSKWSGVKRESEAGK